MGFFLVMKAELVRSWIITRRYWFRTVIGMAVGYGMLMVLITGILSGGVGGDWKTDPEKATNFALGFIVGMFAFGIVGAYTQGLQAMANSGILEQLCLSPHGLITNFLARTIVGAVWTIITSAALVWLVAYSVGGTLHYDLPAVLVIMALTFTNLLGFGFLVGGLVLVFKQVGQLAMILRMVLFGLAVMVSEDMIYKSNVFFQALMHAMPIADASVVFKYVLIKGQVNAAGEFVSVFLHPSFFFLMVSCGIWMTLGITLFKAMENYSRSKGTLGSF